MTVSRELNVSDLSVVGPLLTPARGKQRQNDSQELEAAWLF